MLDGLRWILGGGGQAGSPYTLNPEIHLNNTMMYYHDVLSKVV